MHITQDKFFILLLFVLVSAVIYLLAPVLTPFFVGALLAYLANPTVNRLSRHGLPRVLSITLVFVFIFVVIAALCLLLLPLIGNQINAFIEMLLNAFVWMQDTLIPWLKHLGFDEEAVNPAALKKMLVENWAKAGGMVDWVMKTVLTSSLRMIEWMLNLLLIPVVTFYLLCDWTRFLKGLRDLLPRSIEPTVVKLVKQCDSVLSAFFRGQLLVMIALSAIYAIGLTLIGLKTGLVIGLIAGVLCIVPYLGSIVGIVVASIAAFMQFGSLATVGLVWVVFIVAHVIDNLFLTPRLIGDRIGLHPVAVIFAVLAGGNLFGFLGVLLALPVAAMFMVWLRYLHECYQDSRLYKAK